MIVFDLICPQGHRFEGWFQSNDAFHAQSACGDLVCPVCGDERVRKAPMAPAIIGTGTFDDEAMLTPDGPAHAEVAALTRSLPEGLQAELRQVMDKIRQHVERHCDYVGERFAEEARAIHYGEAEERGIYGEASPDDADDLRAEGIDITPLPAPRKPDA